MLPNRQRPPFGLRRAPHGLWPKRKPKKGAKKRARTIGKGQSWSRVVFKWSYINMFLGCTSVFFLIIEVTLIWWCAIHAPRSIFGKKLQAKGPMKSSNLQFAWYTSCDCPTNQSNRITLNMALAWLGRNLLGLDLLFSIFSRIMMSNFFLLEGNKASQDHVSRSWFGWNSPTAFSSHR